MQVNAPCGSGPDRWRRSPRRRTQAATGQPVPAVWRILYAPLELVLDSHGYTKYWGVVLGSMRLESVEILGFKSFCDRQQVSFNGGVTGIVGPNGCGKSNISDAINWVLGEQSVKSLRGTSMEDVIFAGSSSRQPLQMAEVNLKLKGLNGNSPDGSPDCLVTRRLYRNGDSEYLMNGRTCRLRDIHEMFMDTGLGSKAYSIIEQGKIGQILSTKPADRRRHHRGGGGDHEVQGSPPPDPAQAGGRAAEPPPGQRHRQRGREAAREPEAAGGKGPALARGPGGDAGRRTHRVRAPSSRAERAGAGAGRAPRGGGGARARRQHGPRERGGADRGAPPGPLRAGRAARGGPGAARRADPRRGPPRGTERSLPGADRGNRAADRRGRGARSTSSPGAWGPSRSRARRSGPRSGSCASSSPPPRRSCARPRARSWRPPPARPTPTPSRRAPARDRWASSVASRACRTPEHRCPATPSGPSRTSSSWRRSARSTSGSARASAACATTPWPVASRRRSSRPSSRRPETRPAPAPARPGAGPRSSPGRSRPCRASATASPGGGRPSRRWWTPTPPSTRGCGLCSAARGTRRPRRRGRHAGDRLRVRASGRGLPGRAAPGDPRPDTDQALAGHPLAAVFGGGHAARSCPWLPPALAATVRRCGRSPGRSRRPGACSPTSTT